MRRPFGTSRDRKEGRISIFHMYIHCLIRSAAAPGFAPSYPSLKYQEAENNPMVLRGLFGVTVQKELSLIRAPGVVAGNFYL